MARKVKLLYNKETAYPVTIPQAVVDPNTKKPLSDILNTLSDSIDKKQDTLVSGQDIKTINGNPIVGKGNISLKTINGEDIVGTGNISISSNVIDTSKFATTQYVDGKIEEVVSEIPKDLATENWVNKQGFITAIPSEYVTEKELTDKGYLTSIPTQYVTESELNATIEEYATQQFVITKIAEAQLEGSEVTIPVTDVKVNGKSVVVNTIANITIPEINDVPTDAATQSWVIDNYYNKSDIDAKLEDLVYGEVTPDNPSEPDEPQQPVEPQTFNFFINGASYYSNSNITSFNDWVESSYSQNKFECKTTDNKVYRKTNTNNYTSYLVGVNKTNVPTASKSYTCNNFIISSIPGLEIIIDMGTNTNYDSYTFQGWLTNNNSGYTADTNGRIYKIISEKKNYLAYEGNYVTTQSRIIHGATYTHIEEQIDQTTYYVTIGDNQYKTEKNIQWSEWVNNPNYSNGFYLDSSYIVKDGFYISKFDGSQVPLDEIVDINYEYSLTKLIPFQIDGIPHYAQNGDTFDAWVDSNLNTGDYYKNNFSVCSSDGPLYKAHVYDVIEEDKNYSIDKNSQYREISFSINSIQYKAKLNMTWNQWCNDNTLSNSKYLVFGDKVYEKDTFKIVMDNNTPVSSESYIFEGVNYNANSGNTITFIIEGDLFGQQYKAEQGMTFEQWCSSQYNIHGYYCANNRIISQSSREYVKDINISDVISEGIRYWAAKTVNFQINGITYSSGLYTSKTFVGLSYNWQDWCNSDFNTSGFKIKDGKIYNGHETFYINNVNTTDHIQEDNNYSVVNTGTDVEIIHFNLPFCDIYYGEDLKPEENKIIQGTAVKGMTWNDWYNSEYVPKSQKSETSGTKTYTIFGERVFDYFKRQYIEYNGVSVKAYDPIIPDGDYNFNITNVAYLRESGVGQEIIFEKGMTWKELIESPLNEDPGRIGGKVLYYKTNGKPYQENKVLVYNEYNIVDNQSLNDIIVENTVYPYTSLYGFSVGSKEERTNPEFTWEQWIDSEYNLNNYFIKDGSNKVFVSDSEYVQGVTKDNLIVLTQTGNSISYSIASLDNYLNKTAYNVVYNGTGNTGTSSEYFVLKPNVSYIWGEVNELFLAFEDRSPGSIIANEYVFQFTCGSASTEINYSTNKTLILADDAPVISPYKTYQVSILEGLVSIIEYNVAGYSAEDLGYDVHQDPPSVPSPIEPNQNNYIKKVLGTEYAYLKSGYFYVWDTPIEVNSDFSKLEICFGKNKINEQLMFQFRTGNIESEDPEYKPLEFYQLISGTESKPDQLEKANIVWQNGEELGSGDFKLKSNTVYQVSKFAEKMMWKSFAIGEHGYQIWDTAGIADKILDLRECLPIKYHYAPEAIELEPNVIYNVYGYDYTATSTNVTLKDPYDGQTAFYILQVEDSVKVNLPENIKLKNPIIVQQDKCRTIYILNNLATVIYT